MSENQNSTGHPEAMESSGQIPIGLEVPTRKIPVFGRRIRTGLILTLAGFLVFLIGAVPNAFFLDRSPLIGFVQIAVFLVGLAVMCIGGYTCMMALWQDTQPSIAADIGVRLVATGYVVAVFAGMADVFGLGSQSLPKVPFFGAWQARGVEIGQAMIGIGFLLMIPYFRKEKKTGSD